MSNRSSRHFPYDGPSPAPHRGVTVALRCSIRGGHRKAIRFIKRQVNHLVRQDGKAEAQQGLSDYHEEIREQQIEDDAMMDLLEADLGWREDEFWDPYDRFVEPDPLYDDPLSDYPFDDEDYPPSFWDSPFEWGRPNYSFR